MNKTSHEQDRNTLNMRTSLPSYTAFVLPPLTHCLVFRCDRCSCPKLRRRNRPSTWAYPRFLASPGLGNTCSICLLCFSQQVPRDKVDHGSVKLITCAFLPVNGWTRNSSRASRAVSLAECVSRTLKEACRAALLHFPTSDALVLV